MSLQPLKARVFRADKCVAASCSLCVHVFVKKQNKPSAGREVVSEPEGAPRASERLINPNSSSLNEDLITLADSLKTGLQGPARLMLTYMIVWSEGKSFHYAIKIPCVFMCMCMLAHLCLKQLSAQPTSHTERGGHCA